MITTYKYYFNKLFMPDHYDCRLHHAIRDNDIASVKRYLSKGANPNAVWRGKSALMHAASLGRAEMVADLLQYGANVHAVNEWGETALFNCDEKTCRILIDAGAKIEIKNELGGGTPLLSACCNHRYETAKRLILSGANVNAQKHYVDGKPSYTSLMYVVSRTRRCYKEKQAIEMVNVLLNAGASPTIVGYHRDQYFYESYDTEVTAESLVAARKRDSIKVLFDQWHHRQQKIVVCMGLQETLNGKKNNSILWQFFGTERNAKGQEIADPRADQSVIGEVFKFL